jgi:hypothetical protein
MSPLRSGFCTAAPPLKRMTEISTANRWGAWDTNSDSEATYGLSHHVEDRLLPLKQTVRPLDSADSSPSTPRRERVLAHILLTTGRHRVAQDDTRTTQDDT